MSEVPLIKISEHRVATEYQGSSDPSLLALAETFLQRLPRTQLDAILEWTRFFQLNYSTLCSGTDAPVLCVNALASAASEILEQSLFMTHDFGCEFKERKQAFLSGMFPGMQFLFRDVQELHWATAFEVRSGSPRAVPCTHGCVAGFPCQDASSTARRSCVQQRTHRIERIAHVILKHARSQQRRVFLIILENALGLAKRSEPTEPSNADHCVHLLHQYGFFCHVLRLHPRLFGRLNSRPRLFFMCVRLDYLEECCVSIQDARALIDETMQRLVGHSALDVDRVILPESHRLVTEKLRSFAERPLHQPPTKRARVAGQSASNGWGVKHSRVFEVAGRSWTEPNQHLSVETRTLFPGVCELSDRQCDLLSLHSIPCPDPQRRIVDLSRSVDFLKGDGNKAGRAGCLSAGSQLWLGHRGRFALGIEYLMLLGIYYHPDFVPRLASYPDCLLRDLAGNASDAASFMGVWVCHCSLLAHCHRAKADLASALRRQPKAAVSDADRDSSDDFLDS